MLGWEEIIEKSEEGTIPYEEYERLYINYRLDRANDSDSQEKLDLEDLKVEAFSFFAETIMKSFDKN
jgi:hypothetical protein